MTARLLNAPPEGSGVMTSGGTESIVQAVRVARDRARAERGVVRSEVGRSLLGAPGLRQGGQVLRSRAGAHPARPTTCAPTFARPTSSSTTRPRSSSARPPTIRTASWTTSRRSLRSPRSAGIPFHTDACVGGFLLPFLERAGYDVPPFDFRVPGVSTMSADVHKYGFCTKGASVVLHRDGNHVLQYQAFLYEDWPGGMYGSLALAGARPASPIAAAWAVMNFLGIEGYVRLAKQTMETAQAIRRGVEEMRPQDHRRARRFRDGLRLGVRQHRHHGRRRPDGRPRAGDSTVSTDPMRCT